MGGRGGERDDAAAGTGRADDPAGFADALDRLGRRWFWWLFLAHTGPTLAVAGHHVGFHPFAWILGPLILLGLRDLRAAAPDAARQAFTVVLTMATVAAVVDLATSLVAGGVRSASLLRGVGWVLVILGLGLFTRAMVCWADVVAGSGLGAKGAWLGGIWRRSAAWCWAGLIGTLGFAVVRAAQLWASGRPLSDARRTEVEGGWGLVLFVAALVLALGPIFSIAGAAGQTRQVLVPPVVTRRRQAPAAGG